MKLTHSRLEIGPLSIVQTVFQRSATHYVLRLGPIAITWKRKVK